MHISHDVCELLYDKNVVTFMLQLFNDNRETLAKHDTWKNYSVIAKFRIKVKKETFLWKICCWFSEAAVYRCFSKAWFPRRRSDLSPWTAKFDRLRFIAQSSWKEHSHQLPSSVLSSSPFIRWVFLKLWILTGKKHRYRRLGCWYIKSIIYKRFLNWNKTFKK